MKFTKENASEFGRRGGRPIGARTKLTEDFFRDLHADWAIYGPSVVERVRLEKPEVYVTALARLMPKEVSVEVVDAESALRALDHDHDPATYALPEPENGPQGDTGGAMGTPDGQP